jgi:hypothetical protein
MRRLTLAANADRDIGDFSRDLGYFIAIQGPAKCLEYPNSADYESGFATPGMAESPDLAPTQLSCHHTQSSGPVS